jgi:hypothetical protein
MLSTKHFVLVFFFLFFLHRKKGRKDDRSFIGDLLHAQNDGVDHLVDLRVASVACP